MIKEPDKDKDKEEQPEEADMHDNFKDKLLGENETTTTSKALTALEYLACAVAASPTAMQNLLAAFTSSPKTPREFGELFEEADPKQILWALTLFATSEAAVFYLNKRYLVKSLKLMGDVLRRDYLTLRHWGKVDPEDHARLSENGLLLWSLLTSLIFASLGGKSMTFLKNPGKYFGFSSTWAAYFATRFLSANTFCKNWTDPNWRLAQHYGAKIPLLKNKHIVRSIDSGDIDGAITNVLLDIDGAEQNTTRMILSLINWSLGWLLTLVTMASIFTGFLPQADEGAETITSLDFGKTSHYQNPQAFVFGGFATALTMLFYAINIQKLPSHLTETGFSIYANAISGNKAGALKLSALSALAGTTSWLAAIGFRAASQKTLTAGFFSYLGPLATLVPDGVFAAVAMMLWSHFQELINRKPASTLSIEDITEVTPENVGAFIAKQGPGFAEFFYTEKKKRSEGTMVTLST